MSEKVGIVIETERPLDGSFRVSARMSMEHVMASHGPTIMARVMDLVAQHIAAEFVENHGVEIAAKLSPDAVANLAVAAAGAAINETLQKKLPDRIMHVETTRTEREVYERGLFGGLRRIR